MRKPLAIALIACIAVAVPAGVSTAETPSLGDFFRHPVKTVKRAMQNPPPGKAAPAKAAPAKAAPETAADPQADPEEATAPPVQPPMTAATVPIPRLRPGAADGDVPIAPMSYVMDEAPIAETPPAAPAGQPLPDEISLADRAAIPPDLKPGDDAVAMPRMKPKVAALATAGAIVPRPDKLKTVKPMLASLPPAGFDTPSACRRSLASLGIEAEGLAPIREGACGVAAPTAVASLENGAVDFSTKAIVNCAVAGAVAEWMDDDVQPAAKRLLGGRVTGLRIAASYVCRGRNNVKGAQLSEHAFGNALDISAVQVSGVGWIEVGKTKSPAQAAFLREIRQDACGPFTTVLGPGVAYHDTHLHLDLAKRRTSGPSKGRYCK